MVELSSELVNNVNSEASTISDVTDLVWLEDMFEENGREDGIHVGEQSGVVEGRRLGWKKGTEIGKEMGFYAGSLSSWKKTLFITDSTILRAISSAEEAIANVSLDDPLDQSLQDAIALARARFRRVVSLLKSSLLNIESPTSSPSGGSNTLRSIAF